MAERDLISMAVGADGAELGWVKALVYGPPGTGKTSLGATGPDEVLVLLTEKHGDMTIKRVNPRAKILYIDDQRDSKGLITLSAKDMLLGVLDELRTKKHPFKTVVLDSFTDTQRIFLADMKGGKVGAKITLPEWGILIDELKALAVRMRNLDMHVLVIALSDEFQDEQNRIVFRPAVAGKKLPASVAQYFNLVAFQQKRRGVGATGKSEYLSILDGGETIYTKTHPALAAEEVPNLRSWIDKIAVYGKEHGEGDMPTETTVKSSPQAPAGEPRPAADLMRLKEDPEVKALFDALGATEAKRDATCQKYGSRDELIKALGRRVAEMKAEEERRIEKK